MSEPGAKRSIPPQARTARRLLWAMPISLVLIVATVRIVVSSDGFRRRVAIRVAETIANQTQGSVQLSGVTFDWKLAPCFQNLQIYTFQGPYRLDIASRQACVQRWFSAVGSGFRAVRVRLEAPAIHFRTDPDRAAAASFVTAQPETVTASTSVARPVLRELTVVFDDLRLGWARMPLPERLASGTVGPIDGRITIQRRGPLAAATIAIRDRARDTRLDGRATPTAAGWDLSAGVEGDLVRLFGGVLDALDLDIRKMPCQGRLGARYGHRRLTVDLDLEEYDVDFAADVVSSGRVVGLDGRQQLRMVADLDAGTLALGPGVVELNGVPADVAFEMAQSGTAVSFSAQLALRTIPLARLLRSVPGTPVPDVAQRIDPAVRIALTFEVGGLLSDPSTWEPKLEHRLVGVLGETSTGLEFLTRPFAYYPLTPTGRAEQPLLRGPTTPGWLTYDDVPYVQRRAIITSEDSTFPFHRGVELAEVKEAIEAALRDGKRVRGGSTLTQQLVKNLFLSRERTALRKAVELLLTFHLESVLTKRQLFELYVNLIEWGPGVYGLHDAALHYFGRPPGRLKPLQMVYLATIIPRPHRGHAHQQRGRVPARHRRKVDFLLQRLHRLGQLDDRALAKARQAKIRLRRPSRRAERQAQRGEP